METKEEPKKLEDMNLTELKALAFDIQVQISQKQQQLQIVGNKINEKSKS